jgi:hypothetical protein
LPFYALGHSAKRPRYSAGMAEPPPRLARPLVRWLLPFAAGAALAAAIALVFGPLGRRAPAFPRPPIAPSGQLEFARSELPSSGAIPIAFALGKPSADAHPLPAQIFSMSDQRQFDTEARLDAARSTATIEVDAGWLGQPGTYLVQLKTTEAPLPLVRYVIVVR